MNAASQPMNIPSYTIPMKVQVEGSAPGELDFQAYERGLRNAFDGSTAYLSKVDAMTAAIRMRGRAAPAAPQEEEVMVDSVKGPMLPGPDGRQLYSMRSEDTFLAGNCSKSFLACSKRWDQLSSTERKIMLITAAKKTSKLREQGEDKGRRQDGLTFNVTRPYFDPRLQAAWLNASTIPGD
eukprot:CAMPEP_0171197502 /NCGR_PEP_ID=MMETSP0790-20130122/22446_1 /TAXON_ID=2925 /ORGANISM="Alexandrium catenella, Strain OF101" /LENGTH=180 /DNA_ID=CAMNT_0011662749 /DNA_START=42 /DNA_END=584 /DNA_ORIENTATION=+